MHYDDFAIRISSASSGRLALQVECAEGEHGVETTPEIGQADVAPLQDCLRRVGDRGTAAGHADRTASRPQDGASDAEALRQAGRRLFRSLFPGAVFDLWSRCRGRAAGSGRALRLRLHLDLQSREVAWLAALPWELLHEEDGDGEPGNFLALDGHTSVMRYLDMRRDRRSFPKVRPWRVLVVAPQLHGGVEREVALERGRLVEILGGGDRIEVVFPERSTFDAIRRELSRGQVHALHFMGHGVFDETTGEGGLILEGEWGRGLPLTGAGIGNLVRGPEAPALVVLNACDTARAGTGGGPEAFAGAAAALMEAGVSAVVAMQLPIAHEEAVQLTKILYERLQDGHPVDRAVSDARLALVEHFGERFSWAVPALFSRVPDGRLFVAEPPPNQATADARGSGGSAPGDEVVIDGDYAEIEDSEILEVGREVTGARSEPSGPRRTRLAGKFRKLNGSKVTRVGSREGS